MGIRSSKYTKFQNKTQVDPRILPDETVEALKSLVILHGTGSGKWHPSNRRERRAAIKALRLHVKTKIGLTKDYGRIKIPPKFPRRRTATYKTASIACKRDMRRSR